VIRSLYEGTYTAIYKAAIIDSETEIISVAFIVTQMTVAEAAYKLS